MSARRHRLSVLTFDKFGKLIYRPDAILGFGEDGRINEIRSLRGVARKGMSDVVDRRGLLAIPGLIDAHCHVSQYPAVAADGLELLPWLDRYVFPLETRFRGDYARETARFFFKELAAHGTTTAAIYTSIWPQSTDACFEEADKAGLRVIMGKVMMDRGSYNRWFGAMYPDKNRTEVSLCESEELCAKWHGRAGGRLLYAFSPRFALSCSRELMSGAAQLAEKYGAYIQTHLAENVDEVKAIRKAFPKAKNYTEVYNSTGLLGPKSLLAHAIWLKDAEYKLLKKSGASVVHCPTSNAFLSSGIMNVARLRRDGVPMAIGSDVAAGPSLDLFEVMRQVVYSQRAVRAHKIYKEIPEPTPEKAFHMATRGGANALGLLDRIGTLEVGKEADFTVIDPKVYDARFHGTATSESVVARLVYRCSRAAVRATFVAGRKVWGKF